MLLALCQWIEGTSLSSTLRESTWGFPIAAALHVVFLAWFGATLLIPLAPQPNLIRLRRAGLALLLASGALLFYIEPVRCYRSGAFRIKMLLLLVVPFAGRWPRLLTVLLMAVIFAARWIAFY